MSEEESVSEEDKVFYATVGELVVISTTLDAQLNTLLMEMYQLGHSPGKSAWLDAIIGTLDTARKIEIIRGSVRRNSYAKVSKPTKEFLDKMDIVIKQRNIVCHTPPTYENGNWGFRPTTAAKILHPSNVYSPTIIPELFNKLKTAIAAGHAALQIGSKLVEFHKQWNAYDVEYFNSRKRTQKRAKKPPQWIGNSEA